MSKATPRSKKSREFLPDPFLEFAEPGRKPFHRRGWQGDDLISLLFRTSIRLQNVFDRRFLEFGITAQEAAVLVRCVEARETSAGKLAQAMGRDKGKITRFVSRLEARRFLTRSSNPDDHRLLVLKATSRGRRMAPRLRLIFEELREQFFDAILTEDIDRLASVLSQMYENAGRLYEEQAHERSRRHAPHREPI